MKSWGDAYYQSLARGYDHGYAAWLADQGEKRKMQKNTIPRAHTLIGNKEDA